MSSAEASSVDVGSAEIHIRSRTPAYCAQCSQLSRYTCPGCNTRSCSAACSAAHKASSGCSGQRNRTAYVPMGSYGLGNLMDDYVYLENVGRHVADWGRDIVRSKLHDTSSLTRGGRATGMRARGGRGSGRGGGQAGGKAMARRMTLRRQLDLWDIDLEVLPSGMAKAQLNQSLWDFKAKTALLTVELRIHPPLVPFAITTLEQPFVLITHRNALATVVLTLLQQHVRGAEGKAKAKAKATSAIPEWVQELVLPAPHDSDHFVPPACFMRAPGLPVRYVSLSLEQPLSAILRGMTFVEFPTIEVYAPGAFRGTLVDGTGSVTRVVSSERPLKRPRLDKAVLNGLLGGYGSEDEPDEDDDVLAMLGEYAGSEDDETSGARRSHSGGPNGSGPVLRDATAFTDGDVDAGGEPLPDSDYQAMLDDIELVAHIATPDPEDDESEDADDWDEEDAEADRQLVVDIERRRALETGSG